MKRKIYVLEKEEDEFMDVNIDLCERLDDLSLEVEKL